MYKRIILLVLAVFWILFGLSIAQETGGLIEGTGDQGTEIEDGIDGIDGMDGIDEVEGTGSQETEIEDGIDGLDGMDGLGGTGEMGNLETGGLETGTGELESGTGDLEPGTGDMEPETGDLEPEGSYHLLISEVYYDGTDERIEITNIGDGEFSGRITLSGAKASLVNINNVLIHPGASMIFGDNLSQISGEVQIGKTGLSLNLIDTVAIRIHLIISGQIEDSFFVDQYRVNKYNDKKTSFEKVGDMITPVITERVINAKPNHLINPGQYFITGTNLIDVSFPPGGFLLPISCTSVDQRGLVKVSEIFWGKENYPPYIELSIADDITIDSLSLSGDLLQENVTFSRENQDITLEKNQKFLISNTGFRQDQENLLGGQSDGFSLVSTGKFLLITISYRQSGQVMDIVYLSGYMPGSSSYFDGSMYQCVGIMDSMDEFSPGFERKFLKYMPVKTVKEIQYIEIHTGSAFCESGVDITPTEPLPPPPTLNPEDYTIEILYVDYDPPGVDTDKEKITLLATHVSGDTTPLDMSKVFRVKVNGRNKLLYGFLPMGKPTTFTKTFGFPNSTKDNQDVVITLNYGDHIFDTYSYNPTQLSDKEKEELTGTGYYVSSVIDGDTFRIKYQGKTQSVRMIGIDAPESNKTRYRHLECFGLESKAYLKQMIDKKRITFQFDESQNQRDIYGRLLAYVYINDEFVNLAMIEDGYAREYTYKTPYQYQSPFKQAELMAQESGVGFRNEKICGYSRSGMQWSGDLEGTGEQLDLSLFDFTITYVLPNPKGVDTTEELGLRIDYREQVTGDRSQVPELDMNHGFTLRVGERKKEIRGNPKIGQEYIFSGNLGLVNKAACVSLFYEEVELAKFCYPTPKEGQKIYASYADFEEVNQESLDIFNTLKMKRIGKNMCTIYKDSSILCRRIPASKAETKTINEKNLYKGFSSLIKNYMMNDWQTIYYDTDLKWYFDLLSENNLRIAKGISHVNIYGQNVPVTSIKKQLEVIETTPAVIVAVYEGAKALYIP